MHASAVDLAARVRSGEISAVELVEASLAAIERLNPELNAFVALCPERALQEAAAIAPGDPRPLCGVPVGIKDLLSATEGLPTTHGSSAFGDWYADHDSAHVRRLREAGAIVIGKTNTPELGLRPVTENARFGVTRNPHDPSLSPGGSSGGSAAAVASGMVPLADGERLRRLDPDPRGVLRAGRAEAEPRPRLDRAGLRARRRRHAGRRGARLDGARRRRRAGGDRRVRAGRPPLPAALASVRAGSRARAAGAARAVRRAGRSGAACRRRARGRRAGRGRATRSSRASRTGTTSRSRAAWSTFATGAMQHIVRVLERLHGRPLDPEGLEPATRGWLLGTPEVGLVDHLEASERLWAYARRLLRGWGPEEVLLTPAITRLPVPAGGMRSQAGVTDDAVRFSVLVRIFNVTGQPAASVPFGDAGGIPLGVQLAGPPGRDDLVLALAGQLEAAQPPRSAAIRS